LTDFHFLFAVYSYYTAGLKSFFIYCALYCSVFIYEYIVLLNNSSLHNELIRARAVSHACASRVARAYEATYTRGFCDAVPPPRYHQVFPPFSPWHSQYIRHSQTSWYGQCPPTRRRLNTRSKVSLSFEGENKSSRKRTRISRCARGTKLL